LPLCELDRGSSAKGVAEKHDVGWVDSHVLGDIFIDSPEISARLGLRSLSSSKPIPGILPDDDVDRGEPLPPVD